MNCQYATKGCTHNKGCKKLEMDCWYAKYFWLLEYSHLKRETEASWKHLMARAERLKEKFFRD